MHCLHGTSIARIVVHFFIFVCGNVITVFQLFNSKLFGVSVFDMQIHRWELLLFGAATRSLICGKCFHGPLIAVKFIYYVFVCNNYGSQIMSIAFVADMFMILFIICEQAVADGVFDGGRRFFWVTFDVQYTNANAKTVHARDEIPYTWYDSSALTEYIKLSLMQVLKIENEDSVDIFGPLQVKKDNMDELVSGTIKIRYHASFWIHSIHIKPSFAIMNTSTIETLLINDNKSSTSRLVTRSIQSYLKQKCELGDKAKNIKIAIDANDVTCKELKYSFTIEFTICGKTFSSKEEQL